MNTSPQQTPGAVQTYPDTLLGVHALLGRCAAHEVLVAVDRLVETNWRWEMDPEAPGVWGLMHPKIAGRAALIVYTQDGDWECDENLVAAHS